MKWPLVCVSPQRIRFHWISNSNNNDRTCCLEKQRRPLKSNQINSTASCSLSFLSTRRRRLCIVIFVTPHRIVPHQSGGGGDLRAVHVDGRHSMPTTTSMDHLKELFLRRRKKDDEAFTCLLLGKQQQRQRRNAEQNERIFASSSSSDESSSSSSASTLIASSAA